MWAEISAEQEIFKKMCVLVGPFQNVGGKILKIFAFIPVLVSSNYGIPLKRIFI